MEGDFALWRSGPRLRMPRLCVPSPSAGMVSGGRGGGGNGSGNGGGTGKSSVKGNGSSSSGSSGNGIVSSATTATTTASATATAAVGSAGPSVYSFYAGLKDRLGDTNLGQAASAATPMIGYYTYQVVCYTSEVGREGGCCLLLVVCCLLLLSASP